MKPVTAISVLVEHCTAVFSCRHDKDISQSATVPEMSEITITGKHCSSRGQNAVFCTVFHPQVNTVLNAPPKPKQPKRTTPKQQKQPGRCVSNASSRLEIQPQSLAIPRSLTLSATFSNSTSRPLNSLTSTSTRKSPATPNSATTAFTRTRPRT